MKENKLFKSLFLICFILVNSIIVSDAQVASNTESKKKKSDKIWNFDILASVDYPKADLAKRFGTSYRIGAGIKHKNEKNWIIGAKFEFITGKQIRDDSLLINIKGSSGAIITQSGEMFNVGQFQRGYMIGIQVGKIFPYLQINKNSGPLMLGSVGFMQYKINLFDRDNSFPQLKDEYKKGYDRLTNGIYVEDLIGYQYLATNKLINFYAGFNFVYGFTEGRRDYLYDVQRSDAGARKDVMVGFKLGWVLPIYKKNVEETFY